MYETGTDPEFEHITGQLLMVAIDKIDSMILTIEIYMVWAYGYLYKKQEPGSIEMTDLSKT